MMHYIMIAIGLILPMTLILLVLIKIAKRISESNGVTESIPGTSGIAEFLAAKATLLVVLGCYLLLVLLTRELHPQLWNWLWEVEVFWPIQITVLAIALLFMFGPRWAKWLIAPALILVIGIYVIEKIPEPERYPEYRPYLGEVPRSELFKFLEDPEPPRDLVERQDRGEIWNLRVVYADIIDHESWSPVITIPVPPRGNYYRIEPVSFPGKLEVMNRSRHLGIYPSEKTRPVESRPLRLQYRSVDYFETALVIWAWTQGHP